MGEKDESSTLKEEKSKHSARKNGRRSAPEIGTGGTSRQNGGKDTDEGERTEEKGTRQLVVEVWPHLYERLKSAERANHCQDTAANDECALHAERSGVRSIDTRDARPFSLLDLIATATPRWSEI
ncbi:MAG: hypothetical protein WEB52_12345 [Dehalococcoidia bacterium]